MNPIEALNILAQATEPGVKLTRVDFVRIQQALETLKPIAEKAAGELDAKKIEQLP